METKQNEGDISSLNSELGRLEKLKEELFSQIKSNKDKLNQLKENISKIKHERNALTDSVKKIKVERDAFNKQLKEKIEAFKKVAPKKTKDKNEKRVNIPFLKKEIKAMEYKVETEGLSFDKEQKLMKIINQKKKELDSAGGTPLKPEARALSNEIDDIRKKADESHRLMQNKAAESQKKHEEVITLSNQLKDIENKQREIEKQIGESKFKIGDINQKLGSSLEKVVAKRKEEKRVNEERKGHERKKEQRHEHKHLNIHEMQQKAEEKLKKGGKLTTEDLLAFQDKH